MKLIQDLGIKNFGTYSKKNGLYECPICKKHFEVRIESVISENTTKCRNCATKIKNTKHGLSHTKLYKVWESMMVRCYKKERKRYVDYGGRGIEVCSRWLKVENFIEDMSSSYNIGLSIDRINNDGNYEPLNCRWATKETQSRNIRVICKRNTSGFKGVSFFRKTKKWVSKIMVCNKTISLGYFKTALEAGYAYDKYVIDNNLEHSNNGLYNKEGEMFILADKIVRDL